MSCEKVMQYPALNFPALILIYLYGQYKFKFDLYNDLQKQKSHVSNMTLLDYNQAKTIYFTFFSSIT